MIRMLDEGATRGFDIEAAGCVVWTPHAGNPAALNFRDDGK